MSMHLYLIARFELLRNLRRRGYLGLTIGLPIVVLVILIGTHLYSSNRDQEDAEPEDNGLDRAGFVDQSGLLSEWRDDDRLHSYVDEDIALFALEAGDIDVYWLIPPDYLESGQITRVQSAFSFESAYNNWLIEHAIRSSLLASDTVDDLDANRFLEPLAGWKVLALQQESRVRENDFGTSYLIVYVFTVVFIVSIMMTNGYLLQSIVEEKESKLIEILLISLRPSTLLGGKILGLGVLGLIQISFWCITGFGLFHLASNWGVVEKIQLTFADLTPPIFLIIFMYFLLLYFFIAAGFAAVGALSRSIQEGPQLTAIFVLPAIIPLWFTSVFVADPDNSLAVLLSLLPVTSPLAMVQRVVISDVPAWQIAISIVLMCLAVLGASWLAGRLFRIHTLLSGRMPRLREIPQLFSA